MISLGVIPAAGRSTRIGNPKPLLDADGASFLERAVSALRDGGVTRVVVGVREPEGPVPALARRLGVEAIVPDEVEDGPIATLRSALDHAEEEIDAVILLPVDHPLVRADTVSALLAERARERAPMVRPRFDGRTGHPVLFGSELFDELRSAGPPDGARAVVDAHRDEGLEVEVDDPGIHVDVDTLPEYRRHFPDSYRKRFQKW